VVARPIGQFKGGDFMYQQMRCNVDMLQLIQLGLTFADENGNFPYGACSWQFHFKFSIAYELARRHSFAALSHLCFNREDMYAQESIDLLTKAGLDFKRHELHGISREEFGEILMMSGLVLNPRVKWISFHSCMDFGYLLKSLMLAPLPVNEQLFYEYMALFFPTFYDIKFLMKSCKSLKGGLQDVADELHVPRIGPQHQAGSDSLLTASTFFRLRHTYFDDRIDDVKYANMLFGFANIHSRQFF
jgi:CCR4-NOT transcription complex subunit 7/8